MTADVPIMHAQPSRPPLHICAAQAQTYLGKLAPTMRLLLSLGFIGERWASLDFGGQCSTDTYAGWVTCLMQGACFFGHISDSRDRSHSAWALPINVCALHTVPPGGGIGQALLCLPMRAVQVRCMAPVRYTCWALQWQITSSPSA